jgi:hypothetical protein
MEFPAECCRLDDFLVINAKKNTIATSLTAKLMR